MLAPNGKEDETKRSMRPKKLRLIISSIRPIAIAYEIVVIPILI
jgi:hypothetical protein